MRQDPFRVSPMRNSEFPFLDFISFCLKKENLSSSVANARAIGQVLVDLPLPLTQPHHGDLLLHPQLGLEEAPAHQLGVVAGDHVEHGLSADCLERKSDSDREAEGKKGDTFMR